MRGTPVFLLAGAAAVLLAGAVLPAQPRGFQVLVCATLLVALGSIGRRTARWLLPEEDPLSRAVAACAVAVAAGSVLSTWLGHLGLLRPSWFLLATAALLLLSRLLPADSPAEGTATPSPAIGDAAGPPGAPAGSPWPARLARLEVALLLAAAGALGVVAIATLRALRYARPGYFGLDDISYHLSAVATWLRHGDLRMIKFTYGDTSTAFYPILGEICSWILIAPLRDSDFFARWTQLPFALFSGLAVAALARRLGLSRRSALLAALLYLAIPRVFPELALTAGNDHTAAFFTLASLDGALALARRPRPGPAAATGLSLGLLLGTKYIGIYFAAAVVAVGLLAALARSRDRTAGESPEGGVPRPIGLAGAARLAGVLLAVAVAAGGYTYLRNAWTAGNPLFPAPVRVLGVDLFPGWDDVTMAHRRHLPEFAIDVPRFLLRRDLFGRLFPFTLLPAALLAPLVALAAVLARAARGRRRPLGPGIEALLVLALPAVFFLQFLYLMHDHRDMRYVLPAVALAALALAWLAEQLPAPAAFALRAAVALALLHRLARSLYLGPGEELAFAAALLAGAALALALAHARPQWVSPAAPAERRRWAAAGALLLALATLGSGKTIEKYQARRLERFPAALALEQAAGARGVRPVTVAYAGYNQPYPYFGSRLQNDVRCIPAAWDLDAQYYRWGGNAEFPLRGGSVGRWWRILGAYGVDFVAIQRSPGEDPERSWMVRRPDLFQRVYEDPSAEVWEIVRLRSAPPRRGRR